MQIWVSMVTSLQIKWLENRVEKVILHESNIPQNIQKIKEDM